MADMVQMYNDTVAYYKSRYGITFPVPTFHDWLRQHGVHQQLAAQHYYQPVVPTQKQPEPSCETVAVTVPTQNQRERS